MTYCLLSSKLLTLLSLNQKVKFMYSYNEFEHLFLRYKLEGVPKGISIEQLCLSNKDTEYERV